MRRVWAVVLIAVGVFAVAMAILLPTVAVPLSKRTPLDLDITQISSGKAKLYDATTGKTNDVTLRATRHVTTDSHDSNGDNTTVDETLCIVIIKGSTPNCVDSSDPRLLSVSTDRVTTNRKSAEAVHVAAWGENVNGDTSVRHTGLAYKWPIDAQKRTYQFFDPDLKKAFPATFQGTDTVKGMDVYKYVSSTGNQPYRIQGVADGTYNDIRTVWVEPNTGAILNGTEHQVQTLSGGTVALDTTLSFEQSAIDYQTNFAQDKIDQLRLAQLWAPIVLAVIALAAFLGAFLLMRRGGSSGRGGGGAHREDAPPDPQPEPPPSYAGSSQT